MRRLLVMGQTQGPWSRVHGSKPVSVEIVGNTLVLIETQPAEEILVKGPVTLPMDPRPDWIRAKIIESNIAQPLCFMVT